MKLGIIMRQHGGPRPQTELVDNMPYDLDDVAEKLKEMESEGLVNREWKSDQGTYEITARW